MMYAQIKGGKIVNIVVLGDANLVATFGAGFDAFVQIDTLNPMPAIGWTYSNGVFAAPVIPGPTTAQLMTTLRTKRNSLLASSDYTQLADAPLTAPQKALWVTYRQALRDLPAQTGLNPASPTFPVPPS